MISALRITLMIALLDGCARAPVRSAEFPANRLGNYRFRVHVPSTSPPVTLEGVFTIERDTLYLDETIGICRYDVIASQTMAMVYRCSGIADVTFRFERADPVNRSTYSLMTTERVPVSRCVRQGRNSSGQTVCIETRREI